MSRKKADEALSAKYTGGLPWFLGIAVVAWSCGRSWNHEVKELPTRTSTTICSRRHFEGKDDSGPGGSSWRPAVEELPHIGLKGSRQAGQPGFSEAASTPSMFKHATRSYNDLLNTATFNDRNFQNVSSLFVSAQSHGTHRSPQNAFPIRDSGAGGRKWQELRGSSHNSEVPQGANAHRCSTDQQRYQAGVVGAQAAALAIVRFQYALGCK